MDKNIWHAFLEQNRVITTKPTTTRNVNNVWECGIVWVTSWYQPELLLGLWNTTEHSRFYAADGQSSLLCCWTNDATLRCNHSYNWLTCYQPILKSHWDGSYIVGDIIKFIFFKETIESHSNRFSDVHQLMKYRDTFQYAFGGERVCASAGQKSWLNNVLMTWCWEVFLIIDNVLSFAAHLSSGSLFINIY